MTDKEINMIIELRRKGYGARVISRELNLNYETVKSYIKRHPQDTHLCKQCGKYVHQTSHKRLKKFCSDECRALWWKNHPEALNRTVRTFTCQNCGKEFQSTDGTQRKYCSTRCYGEARAKGFYTNRIKLEAKAAPCGTRLSDLPMGCICASCEWFVNEERTCGCKAKLKGKI